jgi:hypothetical protein
MVMKKLSEKSRQTRIDTATEWNKNINRVVVSFKPDDQQYYQKWCDLPGKNNLEKIKRLLDQLPT